MSTNWFLVTSAINTKYGAFSQEERFNQTIETAKSIKNRIDNVKIILLEGAENPLIQTQMDILNEYYNNIVDFNSESTVSTIHSLHQEDVVVKSPLEVFMLMNACINLPIQENDRVFKISGRYELSDNFDFEQHNHPGKYTFKTKELAERYTGLDYQYKTRLYSFCGSLKQQVILNYSKIFEHITDVFSVGEFIDVEHTMYKILNQDNVVEMSPIGLKGLAAVDKNIIDE